MGLPVSRTATLYLFTSQDQAMPTIPRVIHELAVFLSVGVIAGCSPFDFSAKRAIAIDRERLLVLADQGQGDHLYYAGSDSDYHYLVDTRPGKGEAYKIEPKQLRLSDTFDRGANEPYVVYPHVIAGKKLGGKPKEIPGVTFSEPTIPKKFADTVADSSFD